MDQEVNLKTSESLQIIKKMINQAKGNVAQSKFHIILWGWLVMLMSLAYFYMATFTTYPHPYVVWAASIIGIVASFIYGYRQSRKSTVKTFADTVYKHIWFSFIAVYFVLIAFMPAYNFNVIPMILLIAAMATYLSGIILKFTPYRWGGLWILITAVVAFIVPREWQPLVSAAAVLFGYLIPGYMIKEDS